MNKWLIGALLAATAWAPAQAQDNGNWRSRQRGGQEQSGNEGQRPERARPAPQQQEARPQAQAAPTWQTRGDNGGGGGGNGGGWRDRGRARTDGAAQGGWQTRGGNRSGVDAQAQAQGGFQGRRDWQRQQGASRPEFGQQQQPRAERLPSPDDFRRDGRFDRGAADAGRASSAGRYDRQPGADFGNRGNTYRSSDNRGGYTRGNDSRGYDNRGYVRGNDNRGYNDRRYDNRGGSWNRDWRRDDRYDWNRYRSNNRYAYRLPRYHAPYQWSYGYRRFSIGVTLSSVLWGENYWIDDPYNYRLPEAYGDYRWVRYYNDALLIDLRSGQVVDTVYDIFWY